MIFYLSSRGAPKSPPLLLYHVFLILSNYAPRVTPLCPLKSSHTHTRTRPLIDTPKSTHPLSEPSLSSTLPLPLLIDTRPLIDTPKSTRPSRHTHPASLSEPSLFSSTHSSTHTRPASLSPHRHAPPLIDTPCLPLIDTPSLSPASPSALCDVFHYRIALCPCVWCCLFVFVRVRLCTPDKCVKTILSLCQLTTPSN